MNSTHNKSIVRHPISVITPFAYHSVTLPVKLVNKGEKGKIESGACDGQEKLNQVNGGKKEDTRRIGKRERRISSRLRGYVIPAIQQNIKRGIDNEGGQLDSGVL
ncbi:hypothetical protein IHE45_04G178400 [Dioscorea alata]|uniref:Uncharacterized protein n=1 Tax=Dioscorea alata TaxID=55571 RepID=A0ACB7WIT7_DIOAL|nr:hypothetical protein IHE45_04G178400 [Dioscorea alata]